jgi:hypothetical protein
VESRVKLLGHPIHPMLIVLPLGLFAIAVVFDIIYLATGTEEFAEQGANRECAPADDPEAPHHPAKDLIRDDSLAERPEDDVERATDRSGRDEDDTDDDGVRNDDVDEVLNEQAGDAGREQVRPTEEALEAACKERPQDPAAPGGCRKQPEPDGVEPERTRGDRVQDEDADDRH